MPTLLKFSAVILAGAALTGCAVSSQNISRDFGQAVRQDNVAQIADPDAHYSGEPTPGSNGVRTAAAQTRYERGAVTAPVAAQTSSVAGSSGQ